MKNTILPHPSRMLYRDDFTSWLRDSYDPHSPEARASAERAKAAQRQERADLLEAAWECGDELMFNRLVVAFLQDDPLAIMAWSNNQIAARAAIAQHKTREQ